MKLSAVVEMKKRDKIAIAGTSLLRNGSVIVPKTTNWEPGQAEIKTAQIK